MIRTIQVLILLLAVVAGVAVVANRLKIPPAILLVLAGVLLGLVPVSDFITLVGQGLMLPWVIRQLGLHRAGRKEREINRAEEYQARSEAVEVAIERLDRLAAERDLSPDCLKQSAFSIGID